MKIFNLKYFVLSSLIFLYSIRLHAQKPEISSIYWHLKNAFKVETYKNGTLSKTGSGFILYAKRITNKYFEYYSITNEHVLENSDSAYIVLNGNEKIKIDLILDSYHYLDATLFSFKANSDSLGYFTYDAIRKKILKDSILLGDNILTISSPKGLLNSLSNGILSANREINGRSYLQFTAPVSAGSSGGIVLNSKYIPIGVIVSQFSEGQNINFCIPLKIILDSIKEKYSSIDFGHINFSSYNVNELDKHIELNFAESSIILNQYSNDPKQAYFSVRKYKLNELTHGLLFIKMGYEIENHLWTSFLESYQFYSKKYGYNSICFLMLLNLTSTLNMQESFDEKIISALEDLDPLNENSTKIITDFLKGVYAYKKGNYSYSITLFSKIDDLLSADNADTTAMIFDGYVGMVLYSKLGSMFLTQNNFEKAKEAELKLYVRASQAGNKELMGISGGWVAYSLMKMGQYDAGCAFYKKNLKEIENNLIPNVRKTLTSICDQ